MKSLLFSLAVLLPLQMAAPSLAQQFPGAALQRAYVLRNAGNDRGAIALLEPLLDKKSQWPSALENGKAWNLLGAAYQDIGMFSKARRCHESAIGVLRGVANSKEELASALDNLGSVENFIGTPESSRSLREASHRLYTELGDLAGMARTSNNLASIAIHQDDFKAARRYETIARNEAKRAPDLDEDDRAALESVSGALAMHDGEARTATECFSRAIASWIHKHGDQYWMVGLGYSLRAEAYGELSKQRQAYSDIGKALQIEGNSVGKASALYWRTELLHADLFRRFGEYAAASALEQASRTALDQIDREQCAGCVTSVAGFQSSR
jgi:hypothetical protein